MIELTELTARSRTGPRIDLGPVSLALEAGASYALVGAASDGVELLLDVMAGAARPKKGTITVDGGRPGPGRKLAYVPNVPSLPDVLRVDDYLRLAARVRGGPPADPEERLAALGVAPLARRAIGSLTLAEARAVSLAEALTSEASVVLIAEPLVDLDPRAVGRVAAALAARVAAGATVVLSTASPADAAALSSEQLVFCKGKLARRTTDNEAWAPPLGGRGARLFIRSEGARFLLAELASDPTFREVHGEAAGLVVTGADPVAMATAVSAASRRANVELDVLRFEPLDGEP